MNEIKLALMLFLFAAPSFASTAAITGYCVLGATPAKTSGLSSTNKLQGIIPSCTVTVYLNSLYSVESASYTSGGTITGSFGQTCSAEFLGGTTDGTGTITLTGTNTIAGGTAFVVSSLTGVYSSAPTTATLSNGTATCSGTATISAVMTPALATIYSDSSSTALTNPFTADADGFWLFFAAVNQGYDVVLSGGVSPNIYPSPVTLTDLFAGGSFSGVTASGTIGYIPVFTGANSLGNSVIKQTTSTAVNTINFLDSAGAVSDQILAPLANQGTFMGYGVANSSTAYGNGTIAIGPYAASDWTFGSSVSVAEVIAIGNDAVSSLMNGQTSGSSGNIIALGNDALPDATNVSDVIALGNDVASTLTSSSEIIAMGNNTANTYTGDQSIVAIGNNAGGHFVNTEHGIAIGDNAGNNWIGSSSYSVRDIIAIGEDAGATIADSTEIIAIGSYSGGGVGAGSDNVIGLGYNVTNSNGADISEIIGVGNSSATVIGAGSDNIIGIGKNAANYLGAASSDVIQIGHFTSNNGGAVLTNSISIGDTPPANGSNTVTLGNTSTTGVYMGSTLLATNPMTTLGDTIYGGASGTPTALTGNTTATKEFLTQTGTGSVSAAPAWGTIASSDLTTALLTPPAIGGTTPAAGAFTTLSASGGSATKIVCWKSDGKTLGYATMSGGDISACN